jgi:hypothetical protein
LEEHVSESVGGKAPGFDESDRRWAKSVGKVTVPLLAGFSFTAVIAVSEDAEKFRWADAAIISLTVAAVALIAAVQCSKYVDEEYCNHVRWYGGVLIFYHAGLVALLLGLGFVLAPLHAVGSPDLPRWVACSLALAASAGQAIAFSLGRRNWCSAAKKLLHNR